MTERAQGSPEPQRHSFVFLTADQVTPITHTKPLHRGDVTQLLSCTARNLTREHRERT